MSHKAPQQLSTAERGYCLGIGLIVIVAFIYIALNPQKIEDSLRPAIIRFLAALGAGVLGYLFSGNLVAYLPIKQAQVRATGGFASFVLVLVLFYVGLPSPNLPTNNPSAPSKTQSFNSPIDSICKFSGEYPEGWTYKFLKNPFSPEIGLVSKDDIPQVKLIIECGKIEKVLSLSEYIKESTTLTQSLSPDAVKEAIFANREARQISYIKKVDDTNAKFLEIITLDKGIVYRITYMADIPNYNKYESTAKQIIRSFKIIES
jgi:hypothetical protein